MTTHTLPDHIAESELERSEANGVFTWTWTDPEYVLGDRGISVHYELAGWVVVAQEGDKRRRRVGVDNKANALRIGLTMLRELAA